MYPGKDSVSRGLCGVGGDVLRVRNLLEANEMPSCLVTLSVWSCWKHTAAISDSNLLIGQNRKKTCSWMQFAQMGFVDGQFIRVWSGDAQRRKHAVDIQYFAGCLNLQQFCH